LSARAPLLPDVSRRFHDRYGVYVRQLYGTTETGSIAANLDARVEDGLSTVGTPLPGVEVRILSEGGAPVADGARGEIAVRSPASAQELRGMSGGDPTCLRGGLVPD
jgi:long-chain acyl-CoA synthetase